MIPTVQRSDLEPPDASFPSFACVDRAGILRRAHEHDQRDAARRCFWCGAPRPVRRARPPRRGRWPSLKSKWAKRSTKTTSFATRMIMTAVNASWGADTMIDSPSNN